MCIHWRPIIYRNNKKISETEVKDNQQEQIYNNINLHTNFEYCILSYFCNKTIIFFVA